MRKYPFYLMLLASLLGSVLMFPALAQRSIQFEQWAVPTAGSVVITAPEGLPEHGSFHAIDLAFGGALRQVAQAQDFTGKPETQLRLTGFAGFEDLLVLGLGPEPLDQPMIEIIGGKAAQWAADNRSARVDVLWDGTDHEAAWLAFGAELGQYRFDKYKTARKETPAQAHTLVIRSANSDTAAGLYQSQWQPVAKAVHFARDLSTEPSNVLWPEVFVERVRAEIKGLPNLRMEVLDVRAMERLGMGGILAVGQGSARPPRLMLLRYQGGKAGEPPLALVGKGITFDSGGISIKVTPLMWQMKQDMAGAASVTATVIGLARRRAPVNVVAVAALAENMPSGSAARPGDVVRTGSGKTFENLNTDAEGRMVLVDALWYVQERDKPHTIIDVATLTGAIGTALGSDYAGLFTRHDALADALVSAGQRSGEPLWRMPLRDNYAERLRSPIADLRNIGDAPPGAGVAAYFIGEWVDRNIPWAHLDIAAMSWRSKGSPTSPEGASGFGVRLLDRYIRDLE